MALEMIESPIPPGFPPAAFLGAKKLPREVIEFVPSSIRGAESPNVLFVPGPDVFASFVQVRESFSGEFALSERALLLPCQLPQLFLWYTAGLG